MITHPAALCRGTAAASGPDTGREAERRALAVCAQCPIRDDCLEAALADPEATRYRVVGGATYLQRVHIAAVRERAATRARMPRMAAAYTALWQGRQAGALADRKAAARHLAQDKEAARHLGEEWLVTETARVLGEELRLMVADGDHTGVAQVLAALPAEHRAVLLVVQAAQLTAA